MNPQKKLSRIKEVKLILEYLDDQLINYTKRGRLWVNEIMDTCEKITTYKQELEQLKNK